MPFIYYRLIQISDFDSELQVAQCCRAKELNYLSLKFIAIPNYVQKYFVAERLSARQLIVHRISAYVGI